MSNSYCYSIIKLRPTIIFSLLAVSTLALLPIILQAKEESAPDEIIAAAWQKATDSGRYAFDSQIDQTTYPVPSLTNAGRPPASEQLAMFGEVDQPNDLIEITLWQGVKGDPDHGMTIRTENGIAQQKTGPDQWEPIQQNTDVFTPNNDPLSFLEVATNIQYEGEDNRQLGTQTFIYQRYTFEIDTEAYSEVMRQRIQEHMAQFGTVPAGLTVETPSMYQNMTGSGQLWLDENQLPARLMIDLEIPPQSDIGRTVAQFTSDFHSYDLSHVAHAALPFWSNPAEWLKFRQAAVVQAIQTTLFTIAFVSATVVITLCLFPYRNTLPFRKALNLLIVFAMVGPPLIQARQAQAFHLNLYNARTEQEAERAKHEQIASAHQQLAAPNFDPHLPVETQREPVEASGDFEPQFIQESAVSLAAELNNQSTSLLDTDEDGLSDSEEDVWGTCAYIGAPTNCDGVIDPADSDGDGLKDGIEVYNLTTDPDRWDTDGDFLSDGLEVNGFSYNGKMWYLNPNETDTNKDGLIDSLECGVWSAGEENYNPNGICPDSDSDGTPDVWDDDNDNDNVQDAVDISAFQLGSQLHTYDEPMTLQVDGLQPDLPTFVDFQFRPEVAEHLGYIGTVLDWPSNDRAGQIQRTERTTFANTTNTTLRASDSFASNGDIRFTPIAEITIPYTAGHYGNLPVKAAYQGVPRTLDMVVADWVDTSKLEPYGITVRDADDGSGDLILYLPIASVVDDTGGGREAFSFRMLYWPSQTNQQNEVDWAAAHEVRVVWMVQMITNDCIDAADDPETCSRDEKLSVVHVYRENWTLTGLDVREDHGMDVGILYEDPAQDNDTATDDYLWLVSWNLNNQLMTGRDCETFTTTCTGDGERDITVANLSDHIDSWSEGSDPVEVNNFSYDHRDFATHLMMTETVSLLDSVFVPAGVTNPTLMFAREETYRTGNLGQASESSGAFTLDMTDVSTLVMANMSWMPYEYQDGSWQSADLVQATDKLRQQLEQDTFFQPADSSQASLNEQDGKLIWAELYYAAMIQGVSAAVQINESPLWEPDVDHIPETEYQHRWPKSTFKGASTIATAYKTIYDQLSAGTLEGNSIWEQLSDGFSKSSSVKYINQQFPRMSTPTNVLFGVTTVAATTGMILMAAGHLSGDAQLQRTGEVILNATTIVMTGVKMANLAVGLYTATSAATTTLYKLDAIVGFTQANRSISSTGTLLQVAAIWGSFAFAGLTSGFFNHPNQIGFNMALAYAVAQTIVLIIFIVIQNIPIVGLFVGLAIALAEAIMAILNYFNVIDQKGAQTWLTDKIAESLYDVDFIVRNLGSASRLDYQIKDLEFLNDEAGFTTAQAISYTVDVTNTIKYAGGHGASAAKKATFRYFLQDGPLESYTPLKLNDMQNEWSNAGHRKLETNTTVTVLENGISFAAVGSGINQDLGGHFYLTEGYIVPYIGCWKFTTLNTSCTTYSITGTTNIDIGEFNTFDILPTTLKGFHDLGWGNKVKFPQQIDQDGDGLTRANDPYPNIWDGDGDGLSDYYEVANGLDPYKADGDGDGLTDSEELRRGLNPRLADADDDGLTDKTEWEGWQVVYDYAEDGTPLLTWAWPDPYRADMDNDRLSDKEESFYALHPRIPSSEDTILNTIQFSEGDVTEVGTPLRLFRFDEGANATSFFDNASREQAVCDGTTCPTAAGDGRYNRGVAFDGTDDYLQTDFVLDPSNTNFTAALWFNVNDLISTRNIMQQADGSGTGRSWLYVNTSGTLATSLGGSEIASSVTVGGNEWHHAAVTYDGSAVTLYLNGQVANGAAVTPEASNGDLLFGIDEDNINLPFSGSLDEIVIYDTALDGAGINDLMDGKYNVNDLTVAPGDSIDIQLTISNTNPVYPAKVVYYGNPDNFISTEAFTYTHRVRFDEAAGATSYAIEGSNSNGSCNNGAGECPTAGQAGQIGNAIYLEADDELNFDAIMDDYTGDGSYTISFWFNPDAGMTNSFNNIMLRVLDNNGGENDSDSRISLGYNSNEDSVPGADIGVAPPGQWYNFTIAYNANSDTVSRYLDGVLLNEFIRTDWGIQNGDRLRIGGPGIADLSSDREYAGYIDDLIFFDRHLTEEQLQITFAGGNPESPVLPTVDNYTVTPQNSIDISALFTVPENQSSGSIVYSQLAEAALDIPDQRSVQLDPGMMIHFDEPQGSSGNGNLFIYPEEDSYCDGGCPALVEDFAGLAAEFDGVTGHSYGFSPNASYGWADGAWSMSAWIYPTHTDNVARGIMGSRSFNTPSLFMTGNNTLGFAFYDGSGWNTDYVPAGTIVRNRWNQVGMTYDGAGNFQAYVNGKPVGDDAAIAGKTASLLSYHFVGKIGTGYQPFQGRIDNVVLYDQLLSDGQMSTLQGTEDLSLHLHYTLDEPPGTSTFIDSAGVIGDGSCNNCPSLGIRGPVNRAAYFEGDQINSLANLPNHWFNHAHGAEWTLSFWMKAEHGRLFETKGTANPFQIYTNRWNYGRTNDTGGFSESSNMAWGTPSATEWTHIMLSFDNENYQAGGIFVNGEKVSGGGTLIEWDPFGSNPFRVGGGNLDGYIDDVRFYNRVFSEESAVQLYEQTRPQLQLEFEENGIATSFADQSPNDYSGNIVNAIPGLAGRIGNGVNFTGSSSVNLGTAANINTITETLTIMTWVRPAQLTSDPQLIIGSGLDNSVNGFGFGIQGSGLWFSDGTTTVSSGNIGLVSNSWQLVGVKVGTDGTVTFFLDGEPVGSQGTVSLVANSDDDLFLGGRTQPDGSMGDYLFGQIDELFIYNRALPNREIGAAYDNQFRWFRQQIDTTLIVDNDVPTITLQTTQTHWPNSYIQLAVGTVDPTSTVWSFEMGLQGPSDGAMTWQAAPACDDGVFGAIWCPGFDPSTLDGEGAYQLQFRAIDAVGNETTSEITTIYVDDTAPEATAGDAFNNGILFPINGRENVWQIEMYGSVHDSGGVGASGVDRSNVVVQLFNEAGLPVGEPQLAPEFIGGGWQMYYEVFGRPHGRLAMQVTVTDNVGNSSTTLFDVETDTDGVFEVDARPPSVELDHAVLASNIISQPVDITGFASESPTWGGPLARYHFEELDGTTVYDMSGNDNDATCVDCPTHVTGQVGQALQFDGVNDSLTTPFLINPYTTTFSIALWFNADGSTAGESYRPLVSQLDEDGIGRVLLFLHTNDEVGSNLGFGNSGAFFTTETITHDSWHHVVLTFDGADARIYLDGKLEVTHPTTAESTIGDLLIGQDKPGTTFFTGLMDEVQIFDRALNESEIASLPVMNTSGVNAVQFWLEEFNFFGDAPAENWQAVTLGSQDAHFTTWETTLPGDLNGFYQFNLRSEDAKYNLSGDSILWRGIIDMITPTVSISAEHLGAGSAAYTEIAVTATDDFLDLDNLDMICDAETWQHVTYQADQTRTREITATCRLPGHDTTPISATACDLGGRCATDSVTLSTSSNTEGVVILSPTNNGTITSTTSPLTTTLSGVAYDPDGISQIELYIDGVLHDQTSPAGSPTNVAWSLADWQPISSGQYTLRADMTDTGNNTTSDTINVEISFISCYTEYTGDGVTDFSSGDASAINQAIEQAPAGTIVRVAGFCGNFSELSEMLTISKTVNIEGGYEVNGDWSVSDPAAHETILSGEENGRVIHITTGADVTLRNLTIANGERLDGAGIYQDDGASILENLIIRDNRSFQDGGGLNINGGTMVITGSQIISNTAGVDGGGLMVAENSTVLTMTQSLVAHNSSTTRSGGGMYNAATTTIDQSTFEDNQASTSSGGGGGIYHTSSSNPIVVKNSVIYNNRAQQGGGLLFIDAWTLQNSTVSGNYANLSGGMRGVDEGTIEYSSIISNTNGGGVEFSGSPTLIGTIIANNAGKQCRNGTSINDQGYNLISDEHCPITASTSITGTDPLLMPLGDYGGETLTHKPLIGSPVIDAIPNGVAECGTTITTDQMGQARPKDSGCDIGAVEGDLNYAPVGVADIYTPIEDIPFMTPAAGVLSNDSDPNGDSITAVLETDVVTGTLELASSGAFTYTAPADYCGPDGFTYRASDGLLSSDPVTVTIDVLCTNDPPSATADTFMVEEDAPASLLDLLANDSDVDGHNLIIDEVGTPSAGGTAVISGTQVAYSPAENYFGTETFSYVIRDTNQQTNTSTVTVTVTAVNDDPIAVTDSFTVTEDSQGNLFNVLDNDSDIENEALTITEIGQLSEGGSAVISGSQIVYTPTLDFAGTETFSYTVSDGVGGQATAAVSVRVTAVNDDPEAVADSYTVVEDTPNTLLGVLDNDSDIDGDSLFIDQIGPLSQGGFASVSGSQINYTPANNFVGTEVFSYTVSDGFGGEATAAVTVTITAINDDPIAVNDGAETDENTPVDIFVLTNDSDIENDDLTIDKITQGENGSVVQNGDRLVYTPNNGYSGSDTFSYTVIDGNGGTSTAFVTVLVNVVNTTPTAEAGGPYTVNRGQSITLDGSGSLDAEQDPATLTYLWDFNNDGLYNDASGITTTFSALSLQAPMSVTIGIQVTDAGGLVSTDTALVNVIEAEFELVVNLSGSGIGVVTSDPAGISCGATCSATYLADTLVALTATPAGGSEFVGWGDTCGAETSATCVVSMGQVQAVTAVFADKPGPGFNPAPLKSPQNGSEIASDKVTFDWDGAFSDEGDAPISKYTLSVTVTLPATPAAGIANSQTVTYTFETTETSLTPDFDFPGGEYEWTVEAEDTVGNVTPAGQVFAFTRSASTSDPMRIYLPMVIKIGG